MIVVFDSFVDGALSRAVVHCHGVVRPGRLLEGGCDMIVVLRWLWCLAYHRGYMSEWQHWAGDLYGMLRPWRRGAARAVLSSHASFVYRHLCALNKSLHFYMHCMLQLFPTSKRACRW